MGDETLGNLNNEKIEDILNSTKLFEIQQALLNGESAVNNCQGCRLIEKRTGLSAIRQNYLKFYPTIDHKLQLKNLDIRWNNSCNLGCMYCTPTFSSTWQDRLNIRPTKPVNDYADSLEQFIVAHAHQVQEIMLVGGEPMLMKQNAKLFAVLPRDTRLSIITNISYDIEKLPYIKNLLDRPRENVVWSLSLENTGQQFEYVRNGGRWKQVEKNISFLIKHWPDTVSIIMVYSMFSAFDLVSSLESFRCLGIKKFTFQTYFGNPAFDVFGMPAEIKQTALTELMAASDQHIQHIHTEDRDLFQLQNIDSIIDQLKNNIDTHQVSRKDFYSRVEWCNQWSKIPFQQLWPHVVKLVDQHLI